MKQFLMCSFLLQLIWCCLFSFHSVPRVISNMDWSTADSLPWGENRWFSASPKSPLKYIHKSHSIMYTLIHNGIDSSISLRDFCISLLNSMRDKWKSMHLYIYIYERTITIFLSWTEVIKLWTQRKRKQCLEWSNVCLVNKPRCHVLDVQRRHV